MKYYDVNYRQIAEDALHHYPTDTIEKILFDCGINLKVEQVIDFEYNCVAYDEISHSELEAIGCWIAAQYNIDDVREDEIDSKSFEIRASESKDKIPHVIYVQIEDERDFIEVD